MTKFRFQGTGETIGGSGRTVLLVAVLLLGGAVAAGIVAGVGKSVHELLIIAAALALIVAACAWLVAVRLVHAIRQAGGVRGMVVVQHEPPVAHQVPMNELPGEERPAIEQRGPRELHLHTHHHYHGAEQGAGIVRRDEGQ